MNVSELDVPPEDVPPDVPEPEPEPPLTVLPPGRVRVAPFVENTTFPFKSVRYTEIPAEESLVNAAEVG